MRRALLILLILLTSIGFAENVTALDLSVGEVTYHSVTLTWAISGSVEYYILYLDDGRGTWWSHWAFENPLTNEYTVTGLEPDKTYRFGLVYCYDVPCVDSQYSNVVDVKTKEDPSVLYTILAIVTVIAGIVILVLLAMWDRRTERD